MAVFASDNFAGSAGTELSSYNSAWVKITGNTGNYTVTDAERIRGTSIVAAAYYHNVAPASADYSVQALLRAMSVTAGQRNGIGVRASNSANSLYFCRLNGTSGWELYKRTSGTNSLLGSAAQSITAGDELTIKLDVATSGSNAVLNFYVNGSLTIGPITDSSPLSAAGFGAIYALNAAAASNTTGYHLDNWQAEEAGGGSIDIAGGSTGTGAASASLTTAITVTGSASGSASAAMALAGNAAAIAGASSASASAALGLTTSIAVTGATSGSSAAALELSGASSAAIAGSASASASSAMALTTDIRVAGGASGSAAASMLLAGSLPIEIAGGTVATAQAFAELTTAILIAGATGGNCTAALELYEQEFIENVSGRVMRVEDAGRSFRVPREVEASPVRRERTMRVGRAN